LCGCKHEEKVSDSYNTSSFNSSQHTVANRTLSPENCKIYLDVLQFIKESCSHPKFPKNLLSSHLISRILGYSTFLNPGAVFSIPFLEMVETLGKLKIESVLNSVRNYVTEVATGNPTSSPSQHFCNIFRIFARIFLLGSSLETSTRTHRDSFGTVGGCLSNVWNSNGTSLHSRSEEIEFELWWERG
jgi:hypothetical protein